MAETNQKITALKNKILARESKLAKLERRMSVYKDECKALQREINALNDEIRRIELEPLSAPLKENGITADDISAAIADGTIIKKKKTVAEEVTDADEKNGATYITNEEKAVEE